MAEPEPDPKPEPEPTPDPDPTPDPEPEPQPTPGPDQPSDDETICLENATDNVVFFQNTEGWSTAYVYVWYGKNPATEIAGKWPGTEMTKVGENYYKFALPTTPEDNWMIIFNNGSGTQTKDLNLQNRHVYKLDGNSEEVVVLCEELMGVEELEYQQTTHVSKTIIDGHLLITIDEHVYDVTGTLLR